MVNFRIQKGETLFEDEEDNVVVFNLQRRESNLDGWETVLSLHLEGGRAWGDEIDQIYRHVSLPYYIIHVSGFGYWGDSEFYRSQDNGFTWEPYDFKYGPAPADYVKDRFITEGE